MYDHTYMYFKTIFADPSPIAEVFKTARDKGRSYRRSDEYEEGRFKMALDSVLSSMVRMFMSPSL